MTQSLDAIEGNTLSLGEKAFREKQLVRNQQYKATSK